VEARSAAAGKYGAALSFGDWRRVEAAVIYGVAPPGPGNLLESLNEKPSALRS